VRNCALVSPEEDASELVLRYADLGSTALGAEEYPFDEVNFGWDASYEVRVPTRTLSALLDEAGFDRLDFLCLDVEGYEVQALQGLDLDRHPPAFVLIEFWTEERLETIARILGPRYEVAELFTDHDAFFRRVDAPGSERR
jgi:FkbM family methyltransferase